MQVKYTLSPQEISQANDAVFNEQMGVGQSKWKAIAIVLAALAFLTAKVYRMASPAYRPYALAGIPLAVGAIYLIIEKVKSAGAQPWPTTVDMTERGLKVLTASGETFINWTALVELREIGDLFLLMESDKKASVIIPRRAFADAAQLEEFKNLITLMGPGNDTQFVHNVIPSLLHQPAALVSDGETRKSLEFTYRFLDYLDLTTTSYFTRIFLLLMLGVATAAVIGAKREGVFEHTAANPLAIALALLPWILLFPAVPVMFAAKVWYSDPMRNSTTRFEFTSSSVSTIATEGSCRVRWDHFSAFKETRRSFLVWGKTAGAMQSHYLLIPKRILNGTENTKWLRESLGRKLPRSTWFFW